MQLLKACCPFYFVNGPFLRHTLLSYLVLNEVTGKSKVFQGSKTFRCGILQALIVTRGYFSYRYISVV